jgi:hypothetical protein
MSDDARWHRWLYETHSPAELHGWARRLRHFRFCRAVGGHAGDGDGLRVALRADTGAGAVALLDALGVELIPVAAARARGRRSAGIDRVPEMAQPGHVDVDGAAAFVWVGSDRVSISLADPRDRFSVTADTVESALVVEAHLCRIGAEFLDPPIDDRHCICPKYYPQLWAPASDR